MKKKDMDFHCNVTSEDYRVRDDREEPVDVVLEPGNKSDPEPDRESNQNGNTICQECNGTGTVVVMHSMKKQ